MFVVDVTSRNAEEKKSAPGIERGDLRLAADDLPTTLGRWTRNGFTPPPEASQLPEGQFWWSHLWQYSNGELTGTVSFDQAEFEHWHDLTVCYQANGWSPKERHVVEKEVDGIVWPCVVVRLQKENDESALLVFSLFFDDGDPVDAQAYVGQRPSDEGFLKNLVTRMNNKKTRNSTVSGVRQCQVLTPYSGQLSSQSETDILDLHNQTRAAFRRTWLQSAGTKK